jgi:hypothetical protein
MRETTVKIPFLFENVGKNIQINSKSTELWVFVIFHNFTLLFSVVYVKKGKKKEKNTQKTNNGH